MGYWAGEDCNTCPSGHTRSLVNGVDTCTLDGVTSSVVASVAQTIAAAAAVTAVAPKLPDLKPAAKPFVQDSWHHQTQWPSVASMAQNGRNVTPNSLRTRHQASAPISSETPDLQRDIERTEELLGQIDDSELPVEQGSDPSEDDALKSISNLGAAKDG